MKNVEIIELTAKTPEELLQKFLDLVAGKISEEEEAKKPKYTPVQLYNAAINRLACKKGWSPIRTYRWIANIAETSTLAAINILLKQAALILDEQYPDHIKNSKELFVISTSDNRIVPCVTTRKINFRSASLFRTVEDAKLAKKAFSFLFKELGIEQED